jgi:hypothetical protein
LLSELTLEDGDRVSLVYASPEVTPELLTPSGRSVPLGTGSYPATVYGSRVGDQILVSYIEQRPPPVGTVEQPLLDVLGERKMIVLLLGFPGDPNTFAPADLHQAIFGEGRTTNSFYREASRDQMWLGGILDPEGDIWGPYEIPVDGCTNNSYSEVSDMGLQAAAADGIDVDAYQHRVYYFPPVDSCPGGGDRWR